MLTALHAAGVRQARVDGAEGAGSVENRGCALHECKLHCAALALEPLQQCSPRPA